MEKEIPGDGRVPRLRRFLLNSEPLPDSVWASRHRFILGLIAFHAPAVFVFAVVRGLGVGHSAVEAAGLSVLFLLAAYPGSTRLVKEGFGTFGLMTCSALVVHVSGGSIEAHFHFFVMLAVVSLYQSWFPFLLALTYVVMHHGLLGVLHPTLVYNNPAAVRNPWLWAVIHGLFVLAAAVVYVIQWRLNEAARNEARALYKKLYEGQLSVVQQLEEAATMKDELVSVVSHELRTPLTSVIGYVQLVQDKGLDSAEADECMTRIARQAERLKFLVENLLNYRAVGASAADVVDLTSVVQEVVDAQREYPGAENLTFTTKLVPGIYARASDKAVRLIASNLVNNAVKFATPRSVVEIKTTHEGDLAVLSVTNEGSQISESDSDRIFGPFVQLDSSSTRTAPGVGLGLHIVRRTVDAHHGQVDVVSHDGLVSFTVRLPAAPASHAAA